MAAIEVDQFLAQPPERVWHALTDPDLLVRWLMPNDFRPAVGHQFTFRTEPVPQHGFDGSASLRLRGAGPADFPRRSSRSFLAPSLLSPKTPARALARREAPCLLSPGAGARASARAQAVAAGR
jgi:hypothetical protein